MSIEQTELLINQTTEALGIHQNLIQDLLLSLIKKSSWFKESLYYVLKKGLKIKVDDILSGGYYDGTPNILYLNRDLLSSSIPKQILLEKLAVTIRHEITHAVDHINFNSRDRHSFLTRIARIDFLGNLLFNELNCVYITKNVNPKVLNTMSKLIGKVRSLDNYLIVKKNTSELVQEAISHLGSCVSRKVDDFDPFNLFYMKAYQVSNRMHVFEETADLIQVKKGFNLTSLARQQNKKTHLERFFYNYFDEEFLELWEKLTSKQRMALSSLFEVRNRIINNVGRDNICYPEFGDCVSNLENDCLSDLLFCQRNSGEQQLSYFETGAILQEGFDSNLIDIEDFANLCSGDEHYYFKTSKERNVAISSMSSCLAYTFISTLTDELTSSFLEAYEVEHPIVYRLLIGMYVALIPTLVNLISGEENISLFWNFMLPITLTVLKNFIDHRTPNSAPTFFTNTARYGLTSLVIASVIVSQNKWEALGSIGTGVAGGIGGNLVGRSISKWMQPNSTKDQSVVAHEGSENKKTI